MARKRRHRTDLRLIPRREFSVARECRHIVERALPGDARVVSVGPLVLFSTAAGDAWMLDPEDLLALCLATEGEAIPANIVEDERRFAIEWTHDFQITGEALIVASRTDGIVESIRNCPAEILEAIDRVRRTSR